MHESTATMGVTSFMRLRLETWIKIKTLQQKGVSVDSFCRQKKSLVWKRFLKYEQFNQEAPSLHKKNTISLSENKNLLPRISVLCTQITISWPQISIL